MHPMSRVYMHLLTISLVLCLFAPQTAASEVTGYRDFKFGMTQDEATEVAAWVCRNEHMKALWNAGAEDCYDGSVPRIEVIYGDGGNRRVRKIVVHLRAATRPELLPRLTETYGRPVFEERVLLGRWWWFADYHIRLLIEGPVNYGMTTITYFSIERPEPAEARMRQQDSEAVPEL